MTSIFSSFDCVFAILYPLSIHTSRLFAIHILARLFLFFFLSVLNISTQWPNIHG